MIGDMLMIVCLWYSRGCGVCGAHHALSVDCPRCTATLCARRSINVSNLQETVTSHRLFGTFTKIGEVECAFMPDEMVSVDGSRGGVVQFFDEETAVEAEDRFGGVELDGLPMQICYSSGDDW